METEFSGRILLVSAGILLSSSLYLTHSISTYNRFSRNKVSLFIASTVAIAITNVIMLETQASIFFSLRSALLGSIGALLSLFPIFAAITTILLIRITLLTNRSVAASS
ncbi:MAG: hypothetical protein CMA00_001010 [Methanobacteriota archaeon]|nr:MAG: hypothetical protein CMA00_001010 [Euryarchaeota archaeon]